MIDRDGTKHDVLEQQEAMLRLAERDHGITAKRLALETGIPLSTVQSWRRACAPAGMSMADFVAVSRVIPDELTSLCFEPAEKRLTPVGEGHSDIDALALLAIEFAAAYGNARHPGSPGGVEIVHTEAAKLHDIRRRMVAQAVAA
jgi:hypothetical protein